MPLRSREEEIAWLAGFRWGYSEDDDPKQAPRLRPLEVSGAQAWNAHLPHLRKGYGNWRFAEA